jgi:hypothetical protein
VGGELVQRIGWGAHVGAADDASSVEELFMDGVPQADAGGCQAGQRDDLALVDRARGGLVAVSQAFQILTNSPG